MTNTNEPSRSKELVSELHAIRRRITARTTTNPKADRDRAIALLKELYEVNPQSAWSFIFVNGTVSTWKAA